MFANLPYFFILQENIGKMKYREFLAWTGQERQHQTRLINCLRVAGNQTMEEQSPWFEDEAKIITERIKRDEK